MVYPSPVAKDAKQQHMHKQQTIQPTEQARQHFSTKKAKLSGSRTLSHTTGRAIPFHLLTAKPATLSTPPPVEMNKLRSWEFDVLQLKHEPEEQIRHIVAMFEDLGILNELDISVDRCKTMVSNIQSHYSANVPFHNFLHVFAITHVCYLMLIGLSKQTGNPRGTLTQSDKFVLLVAALCHDMDHDGLSNMFHKTLETERSSQLGNPSNVQERHHVAMALDLINQRSNADMLSWATPAHKREVQDLVRECILKTDMSLHFQVMKDFSEWLERGTQDGDGGNAASAPFTGNINNNMDVAPHTSTTSNFRDAASNAAASRSASLDAALHNLEDRKLVLSTMLHCADLSNSVRTFSIYSRWIGLLNKEFQAQVRLEQTHGIPVTEMMRCDTSCDIAQRDVGFLGNIVLPIWEVLACYIPSCKERVVEATKNLQILKEIATGKLQHNF